MVSWIQKLKLLVLLLSVLCPLTCHQLWGWPGPIRWWFGWWCGASRRRLPGATSTAPSAGWRWCSRLIWPETDETPPCGGRESEEWRAQSAQTYNTNKCIETWRCIKSHRNILKFVIKSDDVTVWICNSTWTNIKGIVGVFWSGSCKVHVCDERSASVCSSRDAQLHTAANGSREKEKFTT